MNETDKKIFSSRCREIVNTYSDVLEELAKEIEIEQNTEINEPTLDAIALEYKRRQGIKVGSRRLIKLLNKKAGNI